MKTSNSQIVFNLPTEVQPTAVTVQHTVDTTLWHISSAPRDFAVFVSVCWYMGMGRSCRERLLLGNILEKRTSTSFEQCSRGDSAPPHPAAELQELLELRRPRCDTRVDLLPCALSHRDWTRKERTKSCLGNSPIISGKSCPRPLNCRYSHCVRAGDHSRPLWQQVSGRRSVGSPAKAGVQHQLAKNMLRFRGPRAHDLAG